MNYKNELNETINEEIGYSENLYLNFPYLKDKFQNARFVSENRIEISNTLEELFRDEPKEKFINIPGTNRKGYIYIAEIPRKDEKTGKYTGEYKGIVFKTSELSDAIGTITEQEKIIDTLPVVKYKGIIYDTKNNIEYLFQPFHELFINFYERNKQFLKREDFVKIIGDFLDKWKKHHLVPYAFDRDDFDKHLLVCMENNTPIAKMIDVDDIIGLSEKEEKKFENLPKEYLQHVFQNTVEKEIGAKKNSTEKNIKLVERFKHDVLSPLASVRGYLELYLDERFKDKDTAIKWLQECLIRIESEENVIKFENIEAILEEMVDKNDIPVIRLSLKNIFSDYNIIYSTLDDFIREDERDINKINIAMNLSIELRGRFVKLFEDLDI